MDYDARRYMDCMAELLGIVNRFPLLMNQLYSVQDYAAAKEETMALLDSVWGKDEKAFFTALDRLTADLKASQESDRFVRAAAAAVWMDGRIQYQQHPGERFISLYDMVPLSGGKPVCVEKLNTNDRETGIQLHPKFEVCQIYNQQTGCFEPFANRDVFYGLNGQLAGVSYVPYDAGKVIHHVVLPNDCRERNADGIFRIAFCPMSDDPKLLRLNSRPQMYKGIKMCGRGVEGLNNPEQLRARFQEDYLLACMALADVVFWPEMLGMEALEESGAGTNLTILDLMPEVEALADELGKDLRPPMLTLLPTRWRDGVNSTTVVYEDGTILGNQKKYIPYVNVKENWVEALREEAVRHILMIHIPGVHRIAIVICAEFQPMRDHMARVLCGGLGATLILVPSYSKGEQDFINSLPTLKDFGTTVVWGNCCGAAKRRRVTGGCSIAGLDGIQRFGPQCACGESCQGKRACLYLVKIPLCLSREKPDEPVWENPVEHLLLA